MKAQLSASQAEIARGSEILDAFRSEQKRLQQRQAYLTETTGTLKESNDLLQEISRIAGVTGFRVVRIEPEQLRARATYDEHPFRLDFQARITTLAKILERA